MIFADPIYLYLLPFVVGGLVALLAWSEQRRRAALAALGTPALIARLSRDVNWGGRRWQRVLWVIAAAALMVALARPQWGEQTETMQREGLQVVVALDVSASMLADDIKPTRLERARFEIADLMQRLDGDEVALVLFSGSSFVQFPLTSDYATARRFLQSAKPGVISKPGTNVGDALKTALGAFDETSGSQRVIVLITDGEAHDAGVLDAAQRAADQGVRLYTLGFGSPDGAPVPQFDRNGQFAGQKIDENGLPVVSRLDEATLQEIARIGSGQYWRATSVGSELDALVSDLAQLQHGSIGETQGVRRVERFQWFLALALAALVAAQMIPGRLASRPERALRPVARPAQGAD